MGEVVEGRWADPEELGVFTPNCPRCLVPMELGEQRWECPECGLVKVV